MNLALRYSLLALAILFIVVYLGLTLFRIPYPFELEWMEGGSVDHVRRILAGEKLYVSPSLEFIPFIYPPLYYYVSAFASIFLGIGFVPLRFVSFIASLGCFFVIFQFVKRETGSKFVAILASSLFAATFHISGAWFDLARVDSLFLFFLLLGLYFVRFKTSPKSYILAGVFLGLAFLTKQVALVICVPILVYCILLNWRSSLFVIGTLGTIMVASTVVLNYIHDGWYNYYIFNLPSQHPIVMSMLIKFWTKDLIGPLAIACMMSMFYILARLLNLTKEKHLSSSYRSVALADASQRGIGAHNVDLTGLFYCLVAVGMMGGTWLSRLHSGGYMNVLFPAYAFICILFGLAIHMILKLIHEVGTAEWKFMEIFVYLVCIMQFAGLAYNPLGQIPTQKDLEAGRKFVKTMAQMNGEIFVPFNGYLPTLAGKSSHAHAMAVSDILRGNGGEVRARLTHEIRQAIREKRFAAVILNEPLFVWFLKDIFPQLKKDIEENYVRQGLLFDSDSVFWPVTGARTRPEFIYVPRSN